MAKGKSARGAEPKSAKKVASGLKPAKASPPVTGKGKHGGLSKRGRFIIRNNEPQHPPRNLGTPVLLIENNKQRMIRVPK